ncbi:MAG: transcriptional regulator [Anaerolineae bacterium]|nr:transcriptional regulator [Anaerolineae bacterium]
MNYNEHNPPHFHAEYQNYEVTVEIQTGAITGNMPRRALNLIWTWLDEHQAELLENWDRARQRQALSQIEPLA